MNHARFVTGTGTDVGKTIVSCLLALRLNANYFKPIQSGTPTDSDFMRQVIGDARVFDEVYCLRNPLSPNQAADDDNVIIDCTNINISEMRTRGHLIVEGAGGILSPINAHQTVLDVIAHLNLKTIVVARSGLGTITHTLQTIALLRERKIPLSCIILFGESHIRNALDIADRTGLKTINYSDIKHSTWEDL